MPHGGDGGSAGANTHVTDGVGTGARPPDAPRRTSGRRPASPDHRQSRTPPARDKGERGHQQNHRTNYDRNDRIWMVSVRPGPTPMAEIGAPDMSSRAFTYAWAFFGRSSKVWALVMSSDQPGRFS